MRLLSATFLLAMGLSLKNDNVSLGYQYPRVPDYMSYGPYHHTVRPGETLTGIAWGYYGYLAPMVERDEGMNKHDFIKALTERLLSDNNIPVSEIHHIEKGTRLLMPPIDKDNCATLMVNADWREIDKMLEEPLRPKPRGLTRPF